MMQEPKITPELVAAHGLKPDEYLRIRDILRMGDPRLLERAKEVVAPSLHPRAFEFGVSAGSSPATPNGDRSSTVA